MIARCAWCNSIRNDIGGWEPAEDVRDSGQECLFTHTICLKCLKKADPELHKTVSEILKEEQSKQKG